MASAGSLRSGFYGAGPSFFFPSAGAIFAAGTAAKRGDAGVRVPADPEGFRDLPADRLRMASISRGLSPAAPAGGM